MITTEEAKEIIKAVDSANDGVYFPLFTVVACFGIIIVLLLYIWNQTQKRNNQRHKDSEELLKKLTENQTDLKMLIIRNSADIENAKAQIENLIK